MAPKRAPVAFQVLRRKLSALIYCPIWVMGMGEAFRDRIIVMKKSKAVARLTQPSACVTEYEAQEPTALCPPVGESEESRINSARHASLARFQGPSHRLGE